jgi:hypothetical protein
MTMPSQYHLQSLAKQSISRRDDVKAIERQIIELQRHLDLARAESQTKDKCASLSPISLVHC